MAYGEKEGTIGDWSIQKLKFIEDYLPSFIKATNKALHRYYIDCFAGKGTWIHRDSGETVDGSPSISMKYSNDFTKLFFIEFNPERTTELEQLANDKGCTNYEIFTGDCNVEIEKILNKIHNRAPTFVFIDPSADQVTFDMMRTLSKWKTELFILYPYQMTIRRYLPKNKATLKEWQKKRLNKFFGSEEWLPIYLESDRTYLLSRLLEFYTDNLKNLGYEYVHTSDIFQMDSGPELYMMIWVGKHPVGSKIMKRVYENQSAQLSLF